MTATRSKKTGRAHGVRRRLALQVVGAFAVVSAVGAWTLGMMASTPSACVAAAAGQLLDDLALARAVSMEGKRVAHIIVFDPGTLSYHVAAVSAPDQPIERPNGSLCRERFASGRLAEVHMQVASMGGDNRVGFGGFGQLDQGDDAVIDLALEDASAQIRIAARTGEASLLEMTR